MKSTIIFLTLTLVLLNLTSSGNRILMQSENKQSNPDTNIQVENETPQTIINIKSGPAADCDSDQGTTFISGKMITHFYGII